MSDDDNFEDIRGHFLSSQSEDLIRLLHHKALSLPVTDIPATVTQIAVELGWINNNNGHLTTSGHLIADSCREYYFWLERDKKLPFEGKAAHLSSNYFQGKKVLEIGPGMGSNLFSLSAAGAYSYGLEPMETYINMGEIFSARERTTTSSVQLGCAEDIPFRDHSFDIVLCVSSHQYFDIHAALIEIARVLKPDGELIIIGGHLKEFFWGERRSLIRSITTSKAYCITVANTLSYMFIGDRIFKPRLNSSTSRPIYPTLRSMHRWLQNNGLRQYNLPCQVGQEICLHHKKAATL